MDKVEVAAVPLRSEARGPPAKEHGATDCAEADAHCHRRLRITSGGSLVKHGAKVPSGGGTRTAPRSYRTAPTPARRRFLGALHRRVRVRISSAPLKLFGESAERDSSVEMRSSRVSRSSAD